MKPVTTLRAVGLLLLGAVHEASWTQTNAPAIDVVTVTTTVAVAPVPCCQALSAVEKLALPLTRTEIRIDEKSPLYDFGNGSQPFLLIELPEFTKPYSMSLTDLPQKFPGFFADAEYNQLALQVQTLNADLISKRSYNYADMKKRGLGYEKTVFFNPQNKDERYILVRGDLNAMPIEVTVSGQDMVYFGSGLLFIWGHDKKLSIKPSGKGIVAVEPHGLTPK